MIHNRISVHHISAKHRDFFSLGAGAMSASSHENGNMFWQKALGFERVQHRVQNTHRACVGDIGAGDIRDYNHRGFVRRCFLRAGGGDHLSQRQCPAWSQEGLCNSTRWVSKWRCWMWYGKEIRTSRHVKGNGWDISLNTQG